ncbi:MAG: exodeoxyribonuclease VII large subunit [Pseudomonadota bacterium]
MPPDLTNPSHPETTRDIFTVSRLNLEVRAALENSFPLLWVTGELSNLARPRSGHLYFTLKDAAAQVRCAMFRMRRLHLRFEPQEGQQVLVRARVTLYEPRGDFQLVVEHMEPAGEGALRQQVEALKARLATEGLFDESHKRALPLLPRSIGILTSPSGAAVRDVLTVLKRRCPSVPLVIYPVAVQGEAAAQQIIGMLELANARDECDLLILTRGGGSLEDLMAFNDEGVVRAVHGSTIPVISAVGHEIDTTLADFAADRRAATPSAAAELASPDRVELLVRIAELGGRLQQALRHLRRASQLRLETLRHRLARFSPETSLARNQQHLDDLDRRLARAMHERVQVAAHHLGGLVTRLAASSPRRRLALQREQLLGLERRLQTGLGFRLKSHRDYLTALGRQLHSVSPLATLERGYAILQRGEDGQVVTSAREVKPGDTVTARVAQGSIRCRVEDTQP